MIVYLNQVLIHLNYLLNLIEDNIIIQNTLFDNAGGIDVYSGINLGGIVSNPEQLTITNCIILNYFDNHI